MPDESARGLEAAGVTKRFGSTQVLSGIDLTVDRGTTLSLLGPSGSGKSTLLRLIAGLEHADAGSVTINGHDVTGRPPHLRGVGFVFQGQALFPHLDVAANVGYGLRMAGERRAARRARVAELLDLVGMDGYGARDPATLSGGEAQRVALARALAPRPDVVLLDEPLSGLDQLLRERLLPELRRIFDGLGVTVVAVTHDPTEAAALGQQLAVLLEGRIAQAGDPGEVLARPVSAAVAGLVGHRNVADGRVDAGRVECPWGSWQLGERRDGAVSVLVPPDAVRPDPEGDLVGVVTGRMFRGGSVLAVVSGDRWPALDVRGLPEWRIGEQVRLRIDPAAVHVM